MKTCFFCLGLLIASLTSSGQFTVFDGPKSAALFDVDFYHNTTYAISRYRIHRSHDEGTSWEMVPGTNTLGYIVAFTVEDDFMAVLTSEFPQNSAEISLHRSMDGGHTWEKTIYTFNYIFEGFGDEITLQISGRYLTIITLDTLYASSNLGLNCRKIRKLNGGYFGRSDNTQVINDTLYIVEWNRVIRSTNLANFEPIYSGIISNYFRIDNILYFYDEALFKIENGKAEVVEVTNFNAGFSSYFYDEKFLYLVFDHKVVVTDRNFEIIHSYTNRYLDNVLKCQRQQCYFFNPLKSGIYRQSLISNDSMVVDVSSNMVTELNSYNIINDRLMKLKDRIQYYDSDQNQWIDTKITEEKNVKYGVVNHYEFLVSNPFPMIVNAAGIKIRDSALPYDNTDILNCGNLLISYSSINNRIFSMSKGILPWIEIYSAKPWKNIFATYSGNHFILSNHTDEVMISADGINWESFTGAMTEGKAIKGVQYSEKGDLFYYTDFGIYRYNIETKAWKWVKPDVHPFAGEAISGFAVYKNTLIQSIYSKGIVISKDNGKTWQNWGEGLTHPYIYDIYVGKDKVYVAAHGEVFVRNPDGLEEGTSIDDLTQQLLGNSCTLFPVPGQTVVFYRMNQTVKVDHIRVYTPEGRLVSVNQGTSEDNGQIDVSDIPNGRYFIQFHTNTGIVVKPMLVVL